MGRPKKLKEVAIESIETIDVESDALFPEEGVLDVEVPRPSDLDLWTRVFLEDELSLHAPEAKAARMRVAWRITRTLAILQGRIDQAQPLDAIKDPQQLRPIYVNPELPVQIMRAIHGELPLTPPSDPQEAQRWIAAAEAVGYVMNCAVLQDKDPRLGSQNFWGLLHPSYYQALFPSLAHLATYERRMLYRVLRYMIRNGAMRTYEWLRQKHSLTVQECKMLLTMARAEARAIVEYEQEEERAMMTLRLQDHQERARKENNLREELQSLKQESIVRGLTATQPEGFGDIFGRVVDVIARKKQNALPQASNIQADKEDEDDDKDNDADEG